MAFTAVTLAMRPDLAPQVGRLTGSAWTGAEFMYHDAVCRRYWTVLLTTFPELLVALSDEGGTVVGVGHTIPYVWDGEPDRLPSGVDGVLEQGVLDHAQAQKPTALSALLAVIAPPYQRRGLS